jgi:hypothetical protein
LDLPNRLGEFNNRKLGIVVFITQESINQSIKQNRGQFIRMYDEFIVEG